MPAKKDSHSYHTEKPQKSRTGRVEVTALVLGFVVLAHQAHKEPSPATPHAERLQMLADDDLSALTATPTPFRGEGTPSPIPATSLGSRGGYTR